MATVPTAAPGQTFTSSLHWNVAAAEINELNTRRGCQFRRGVSAQALPANAYTGIVWDIEDVDTDGYGAVGNGTITIPSGRAGIYAVSCTIFGVASGGIARGLVAGRQVDVVSGISGNASLAYTVPLAVGATIAVQVWVPGAVNVTGIIEVYKVGP